MFQQYVTPLDLDDAEAEEETSSETVSIPRSRKESRKRRPIELLATMQGLVIISLLSWLLTGYRTVPEVHAWIERNLALAALLTLPSIIPLLGGVLIGGVAVYAMDRRLSREQMILENLLELIE